MRFSVPGFVMIKVAFFLFFICMYDKRHVYQNIYIYISVCVSTFNTKSNISPAPRASPRNNVLSETALMKTYYFCHGGNSNIGLYICPKDMFIFRHIIHMKNYWNYLTFSDIYAFLRVYKHCNRVPNIDHIEIIMKDAMKALALLDGNETAWNFWVNWSAT